MKITRRELRQIIREETLYINEAFWSKKEIKSIDDVETVGDLRKLIASAQDAKRWEQTKGEAGDAVKGAIVDEILGKIPGASAAKSMFDFVKTSYELPDEARTGTALDALDVDDEVAAIVDDPVENAFLSVFAEDLKSQDASTPIADINMTAMLSKYLKGEFDGRTVAGFQEGKKIKITRNKLKKIIKEAMAKNLSPGDPVTDLDSLENLTSGDKLTLNGVPVVVVGMDTGNTLITYVKKGKAILKQFDYRYAAIYPEDPDDMIPEISVVYLGSGAVPQNTRRKPRKTGPGRTHSYYD